MDAAQPAQGHAAAVFGLMKKLEAAPVNKLMIVAGGSNPAGPECEPMHWHGFIGMEAQAVNDIAGWAINPQP